jgi:hypothetical protein
MVVTVVSFGLSHVVDDGANGIAIVRDLRLGGPRLQWRRSLLDFVRAIAASRR